MIGKRECCATRGYRHVDSVRAPIAINLRTVHSACQNGGDCVVTVSGMDDVDPGDGRNDVIACAGVDRVITEITGDGVVAIPRCNVVITIAA